MILDPTKGSKTIQQEGKGRPLSLKGAHGEADAQQSVITKFFQGAGNEPF